jgi:hypothetical protein
MCRICTKRAQSNQEIKSKKPARYVPQYQDMIYILFGIDIQNDRANCHPRKICNGCYRLLINSKNTGINGEMNLSGKYSQWKEKGAEYNKWWVEHSTTDCCVCELYSTQSKGGAPPKNE